jgi:hypothetical protein
MLWVAGAVFALGIVLGLALRFPTFVAALFVAGSMVLARDLVAKAGLSRTLFDAIGVIVLPQLGYGIGIGLRAKLHVLRKLAKPRAKPELDRRLRRHER